MQNFTTASLKGYRDMEEQILRLQNYINGSRYTVAITGAGISMAAGIMRNQIAISGGRSGQRNSGAGTQRCSRKGKHQKNIITSTSRQWAEG